MAEEKGEENQFASDNYCDMLLCHSRLYRDHGII